MATGGFAKIPIRHDHRRHSFNHPHPGPLPEGGDGYGKMVAHRFVIDCGSS